MPVASLTHLTEFLFLLNAFVIQGPGFMEPDTLQDKAKALLLFAQNGDATAYKEVLADIRMKKKRDERLLEHHRKRQKQLEASIRNDQTRLPKNPTVADSILRGIETSKGLLKNHKLGEIGSQKFLDARVKQEEAFIKACQLIEKERQRAGGKPTLLLQFLAQFATFVGPDSGRGFVSIPLRDKVKALVLFANDGDTREHKKVLAAIHQKKKEAEVLLRKVQGFVKELEDKLRADQLLLAKTEGDTSGIEKRIAATKRGIRNWQGCVAETCEQIPARVREEKAWVEARRLIEKARATQKK